jgi:hypothetical protein
MARDTYEGGIPYTHSVGARRVEGGRRGGLRKLLPLLLALLLAALLAILLISLIGADDDGDTASSDAGSLTAGGAQLLPPPAGGLSGQIGDTASGKDVLVQSVNGNEGFFVGSGTTNRVYVEWGGDVGRNEASRFEPKKGDRVNLTGPVQAAGAEQLRKLKLSPEDRELVRSQGAFVNANRVTEAN